MHGLSKFGLRIHLINKLLVLLFSYLPLELESRGEFTTIDTEVNRKEFPLADICST
jgi:hypothetical protein